MHSSSYTNVAPRISRPLVPALHVFCFSAPAAEDYPLTLEDITVRDPFIHADAGTNAYFLAMLFRTFQGQLLLTLHQPNSGGPARAKLFAVEETADSLRITAWKPSGSDLQTVSCG